MGMMLGRQRPSGNTHKAPGKSTELKVATVGLGWEIADCLYGQDLLLGWRQKKGLVGKQQAIAHLHQR